MNKICSFAGHGNVFIDDAVYQKLKQTIENLIKNQHVHEFWVGNYGRFDETSAHCVHELRKQNPDIKLFLVVPYITNKITSNELYYEKIYDGILTATISEKTPNKFKILQCNNYMVDNSDFLICFVEHSWGGASKTLEYAKKKKIKIINIAENRF